MMQAWADYLDTLKGEKKTIHHSEASKAGSAKPHPKSHTGIFEKYHSEQLAKQKNDTHSE